MGGGVGGSRGGALSDRSQVTAAHQHFVHLQLILNTRTTAAHVCVSTEVGIFQRLRSSLHFPWFSSAGSINSFFFLGLHRGCCPHAANIH